MAHRAERLSCTNGGDLPLASSSLAADHGLHRDTRKRPSVLIGAFCSIRFLSPIHVFVVTITVRITYGPAKRTRTFRDRGLDFEDAVVVFAGVTFEVEDTRQDYGETRVICYGLLQDRLVVIGYVPRDEDRHVFSMRKANARGKARIAPLLKV